MQAALYYSNDCFVPGSAYLTARTCRSSTTAVATAQFLQNGSYFDFFFRVGLKLEKNTHEEAKFCIRRRPVALIHPNLSEMLLCALSVPRSEPVREIDQPHSICQTR